MISRASPRIEEVLEGLELFFRYPKSLAIRTLLALCIVIGIAILPVSVVILSTPVVKFDGYALNGYVSGYNYQLQVAGVPTMFPPLESISTISKLYTVYTGLNTVIAILGIKGVRTRSRAWSSLAAASSIGTGVLINLLYSILRVLSRDVVPILPQVVTIDVVGGRAYLDKPYTQYTWVYQLSWKPLYFFIASSIAISLSVGAIITIMWRPEQLKIIKLEKLNKALRRRGEAVKLITIKKHKDCVKDVSLSTLRKKLIDNIYSFIDLDIGARVIEVVNLNKFIVEGISKDFRIELEIQFHGDSNSLHTVLMVRCFKDTEKCFEFLDNLYIRLRKYIENMCLDSNHGVNQNA